MQSLFIFGRQPQISLAEVESLYNFASIQPIANNTAALVDIRPKDVNFNRLGGSIKLAKVLFKLPTTNWYDIEKFLISSIPKASQDLPKGKLTLALSAYNFSVPSSQVQKTAIKLKQTIVKQTQKHVRVVPNKECAMNAAQIIHNKLTSVNGWEIIIISNHKETFIGQTIDVQNIKEYAMRDQKRPFRDARVGMLPPKLAQIIINLSVGPLNNKALTALPNIDDNQDSKTILDPFCGSGVISQEALIMGYNVIASDLDEKMIEYTQKNLDWLKKHSGFNINHSLTVNILRGDATNHNWKINISSVATEMFLGKPLTKRLEPHHLNPTIDSCNDVLKRFLINIYPQINKNTRLCIAVPAWHIQNNAFHHLPIIDSLDQLGYNRLSFKHVDNYDLIYHRSNQIVGRELLIITKL